MGLEPRTFYIKGETSKCQGVVSVDLSMSALV